jgi:hypothetical protein
LPGSKNSKNGETLVKQLLIPNHVNLWDFIQ